MRRKDPQPELQPRPWWLELEEPSLDSDASDADEDSTSNSSSEPLRPSKPKGIGRPKDLHTPNRCEMNRKSYSIVFSENATEYIPKKLPNNPINTDVDGFVRVKNCRQDEFGLTPKRCTRFIPFIGKGGYITNEPVFIWKCNSLQLLNTLISTVVKRIKSTLHRMNPKYYKVVKEHKITTMAVLYCLTLKNHLLRKFYYLVRKNKLIELNNALHWAKCALSENKRFLFDQMLLRSNILWFNSHVVRRSTNSPDTIKEKFLTNPRYKIPNIRKELNEIMSAYEYTVTPSVAVHK